MKPEHKRLLEPIVYTTVVFAGVTGLTWVGAFIGLWAPYCFAVIPAHWVFSLFTEVTANPFAKLPFGANNLVLVLFCMIVNGAIGAAVSAVCVSVRQLLTGKNEAA